MWGDEGRGEEGQRKGEVWGREEVKGRGEEEGQRRGRGSWYQELVYACRRVL